MTENMRLNIYMSGVGGQGIGVLSEVLMRAYSNAGYQVKGVDTHGLAQRGGKVESHLRIGYPGGNPLIEPGRADIALCLERTEAYRALITYLKPEGRLIYYNTGWQSLSVRLGEDVEVTADIIEKECAKRKTETLAVFYKELKDVRLQNIALLSDAVSKQLLPGLERENLEQALNFLFSGTVLESNLEIIGK